MRTLTPLLLALVVIGSTAFSTAGSDPRPGAGAAIASAVADALDAPDDPATRVALVHALARAAPDARLPAALDAVAGAGLGLPQGDATGDGLSEALVIASQASRAGATFALTMLAPGAERPLWSSSFAVRFFEAAPAVDLDGDGLTDVLVLTLVSGPAEGVPKELGAEEATWSLVALRGLDGATLWTREESGTIARAGTDSAGAVASTLAALVPFVGGDADGDGGADVWLNAYSIAAAGAGVGPVGAAAAAFVDRVDVLSGATGEALASLALAAPSGGVAVAAPTGDVTGDGLADTIATESVGAVATRVTVVAALAGATGEPAWARALAGAGALGVAVADLDGDAVPDVIVDGESSSAKSREALSGATGDSLWTFDSTLYLWDVPGEVDGAPGADLVFLDGEASAGGTDVRAVAISGATGATLYDTRPFHVPLPPGGWSGISFGTRAGDYDGDGALDTLLGADWGAGEETLGQATFALRAADGALAWSRDGALARAADDLTGDGRDDVFRLAIGADGLAFTALDGATGADTWSKTVGGASLLGAAFERGFDFGGSPASDVLVTLVEGAAPPKDGPGGEATTRVEAWSAPDGRVAWRPEP